MLNLLEKYDNKLDELQEDNELKDMKIFEYEQDYLKDRPKIKIESIEEKVRFLVQVLHRLKIMYIEGVTDCEFEGSNSNRSYPVISDHVKLNADQPPDPTLPIERAADQAIESMMFIEENRMRRAAKKKSQSNKLESGQKEEGPEGADTEHHETLGVNSSEEVLMTSKGKGFH